MSTLQVKFSYIADDSNFNRRFVAKGTELNTGVYVDHDCQVRDARGDSDCTLKTTGFALIPHKSEAITDWYDQEQLNAKYIPEIEELVRKVTGADLVIAFGPLLRDAGASEGGKMQPPGIDVHVDYSTRRSHSLAAKLIKGKGINEPLEDLYSRFLCINVWRALTPGPQDYPLAVCDGRTVGPNEGLANAMIYCDQLPNPDTLDRSQPPPPDVMEAFCFQYNPKHSWRYYSHMGQDEALFFTLFDSQQEGAWRVPHAAFRSPEEGTHVRKSVEIRTVAYFKK